jgi:NADH-quinone oxidoreductase subunit M
MEVLSDHNWVLSVGTFLPLVGVLIMLFIPKGEEALNKAVGLGTAVATLAVGIFTMIQFDYGKAGEMQFVAQTDWISVIKSSYLIGVDGISLPLYFLSMVITVLVMIYSWDHVPSPGNPKAFFILMLVLQTGMAGTFIARDLILFFVFFELVLLPMYFMIGVWGGENRQYASLKFFLYTMFGSALMLVAFLALFFKTGAESFSIPYLVENGGAIAKNVQVWIFAGMFVGFAVKVPMFPFHTWLPDAHTQAPTQGSVILAAILLKLGTYGFVRIAIPILPEAAKEWAPWIGLLSVIGIIYGALGCLAQTDMKRLIAFSSVAHMGFVMLGISTLTPFGLNAAMFGMVAHGLITGMLFFLAGSVKERYHTLEIKRLSGMLKQVLLCDGVARLARPRGVLGRVPGDPVRVPARRGLAGRDVPHLHGHRGARYRPRRRLPAVALPAHGVRRAHRRVRPRPRPRRGHPRREHLRVDRMDAAARGDRGVRRVPAAHVQGSRPRGQRDPEGVRGLISC